MSSVDLASQGLQSLALIGLPILLVMTVAAILIGILQAVTSIHDGAVSYGLKLLVLSVTLYAMYPLISKTVIALMISALS